MMTIHDEKLGSWILIALLASGCAGGTDFEDPEHVRNWANSASALAVFAVAYEPVAFADGEVTFADPACPSVTDDGTTVVIDGDCTDIEGERFVGTATVARGGDGARDLTLDGWGTAPEGEDPVLATGTVSIRRVAADTHTFDADYTLDGLTVTTVEAYSGTVIGGYEGATTWSGSGTVTRGGFAVGAGTVTATTDAELRDPDVCTNQAASGTTIIEHAGTTLVVEYDGATDCDEEATARYSIDGEDRGTIDGVRCAATPGRGDDGVLLLVTLLGAFGLALRRRRS